MRIPFPEVEKIFETGLQKMISFTSSADSLNIILKWRENYGSAIS